ncbi:hypothetical protein C8P65_101311 [Capnocytophaga leadbetteri]|uniref:TPM domain-containing protein n=1 Tax=Capnocytophaga leadbetteri TaxID=327575 RepID=A0A2T5XYN3_9FLAO|nr:hypothetical protein [Capnocytophaga leadbetteri]PTX08644.1 hypothetical protein C8P65_101311 [Capnocytophaga leadbetteri]
MKRFVLILLFWGLLPFRAIGQNVPIAEVTRAPEKYYTIEQEPKVQLEKGKEKSDLANDYIREQEKENSFITKVMLLLFSIISFITYLLGYRPLKKIVDDPNLSVYQKYVQLKESNSMWGCVGCLFSILFPPFPLGIIYFLMVRRLRKQQLSAMVCEKCGEKNSQQVSRQNEESVINYFFICRKCGHIHQESIKKAVRSSSQTSSKSSRMDDSYDSSSSYNRSSSSYNKSYRSGGGASTKF